MAPKPQKHAIILLSSSRDRLLLFETQEEEVIRDMQQFGTVSPIGVNRYQVHVSRRFHLPDVKQWLVSWAPDRRPSDRDLVEELTQALAAALLHVEGVDAAVRAEWEAILQQGRAYTEHAI